MKYRGYTISHDPKPIPDRSADFDFSHEDFDGAPDSGDNRCGTAGSLKDACSQIDGMLEGAQEDLFEHIAATIFDFDSEETFRASEEDANAIARKIMTLLGYGVFSHKILRQGT